MRSMPGDASIVSAYHCPVSHRSICPMNSVIGPHALWCAHDRGSHDLVAAEKTVVYHMTEGNRRLGLEVCRGSSLSFTQHKA